MIVILGAQGFVGLNLCLFLKEIDEEYIGIDVKEVKLIENCIITRSPLKLLENIIKSKNVFAVINCAGSPGVSFSINNPVKDFDLNVRLVEQIGVLLKNFSQNTLLVNLSSAAVYGQPKKLPISENSLLNPISPYGFHKKISEDLLIQFNYLWNINYLNLRLFSVYGPFLRKQLFWDVYQKALKKTPITLFGNGNETRDFIFIKDVCNAIVKLIRNKDSFNKTFNIASGQETTINEAVLLFLKNFKTSNFSFNGLIKEGDPLFWKADISLVSNYINFSKTNLKDGLIQTANWQKNE